MPESGYNTDIQIFQQKVGLSHGLLTHEKRLSSADIPLLSENSNSGCFYMYLVTFLKMRIMPKNNLSISCASVYLSGKTALNFLY